MLRNNKQYKYDYRIEEREPALYWYKKSDSKEWIKRNIPTLNELLEKNYSEIPPGVYCIQINGIPVYVGESDEVSVRLIVHAHNLYRAPLTYFGVEEEEINSGKVIIQVTILKENLSDGRLRKETELSYIKKIGPLLQKNDGTDRCIPRDKRRKVIEEEIFKTKKL